MTVTYNQAREYILGQLTADNRLEDTLDDCSGDREAALEVLLDANFDDYLLDHPEVEPFLDRLFDEIIPVLKAELAKLDY